MSRRLVAALAGLTGLAICAFERNAWAYRPFDGTDADVADTGDFELELGPVHYYARAGSHYLITPATVLNLGFLPRWELVVDFQNYVGLDGQAPGDQLLDTDVLLKTVLLEGSLQDKGPWPSLALEAGPLLPNVNGEEHFGASADLIATQHFEPVTFHLNSWFELERGSLDLDWFEGVIIEGNLESTVRPVSELYYEREIVTGETTYSALLGAIWKASESLDLDVGLREASVTGQAATEVRAGLTWAIGLWSAGKGGPSGQAGHRRLVAAR